MLAKQSVLAKYPSIDSTRAISAKKMGRHGQQMDGSVEELNISDNPVGMLGTKAVSELLTPAFNPVQRLTKLILNKCDVPDFGGMALARALQSNATLVELQISGNQLSDAAAAAFGKMLQMNRTLEILDLSWNNIKVDTLPAVLGCCTSSHDCAKAWLCGTCSDVEPSEGSMSS